MIKTSKPTCAICNKPVDAFRIDENISNRVFVGLAECHGDREVAYIRREDAMDGQLSLGYAFANKKKLCDNRTLLPSGVEVNITRS